MTKKELADAVGVRLGFIGSRTQAVQAVEAVLDSIVEGVQSDGRVSINGFGSFKLRRRSERVGFNPATGDRVTIPAAKTVAFTPSPQVREKLTRDMVL